MKLRRALHVLGILATVASGAFVQFASSGGAPRWALNAAAWAGLIAALVTNLGRAIATAAVDDVMVAQTTTTVVSLPLTTTGDLTPVDNPSRQAP